MNSNSYNDDFDIFVDQPQPLLEGSRKGVGRGPEGGRTTQGNNPQRPVLVSSCPAGGLNRRRRAVLKTT